MWVWCGYLDTVGHLAPALGGRDWQRRHYRRAARWTRQLRRLDGVETLVCVSDHGLQQGTHTETAAVGVDRTADLPPSVPEVRPFVEGLVSDGTSEDREVAEHELGEVEQQLESLGYIS